VTEKKNWGDKVIGWFVEQEGGEEAGAEQPPTTEPAAQPEPPQVELKGEGEVPPPPEPGGALNFAAVYRAAGIDVAAQDRVDKAITLLRDLPADAPQAVKRQIVEASLKAFGYPVEQIVEAGEREIQALGAFIELGERNTHKIGVEADARVEALTAEIAQIKESTEQKLGAQRRLADHCDAQKARVQDVLAFFGDSEQPAAGEPSNGEPG